MNGEMGRLVWALTLGVMAWSFTARANAQAAAEARFRPRLGLVVGADAGLVFGQSCLSTSYDTARCQSTSSLPELRLETQLRFAASFSAGLVGRYSWGSRDGELALATPNGGSGVPGTAHEHVSRLSAEGRWHVLGDRALDPSLGFELGFVHSSNRWRAGDAAGSSGDTAPAFGPSVAIDFKLGQHATLGLVLRTAYFAFDKRRSSLGIPLTEPELQGQLFTTSLGLSLGGSIDL